ncbi:fatty acyl-AMP ligase [Micromonospora andamanensis]|uniref:fatty acyl-AMP ligase n=1 Tax=Micromonospora andamanensis TaxID=1287068 RepID=UPI00194EF733|nr:fatty acyl-AMP ligase [Micromonospora andamanensis]
MSAVVPGYPTVVHALVAQAERGPDGATMTVVPEPGRAEPRRYDAVFDDALRCAAVLAEYGVRRGDRVLFCLPTSWTFVTAFFGCQLLGAAPTAIAVPTSFGRASGFDGQVKELVAYLRPAAVVARAAVVQASEAVADTVFIDGDVLLERAASAEASLAQFRLPAEDDLAFIQCTSGSTGRPKGVMISHANLAANLTQSVAATGWSAEDRSVSWLPLYHDMGLISGLMVPVYTGSGSVLMPPTQFLRSPVEWLRNITAMGGTLAAAPNFAYGYTADRVRDSDLDGVDLSSWRMAFCGAEPIHPGTIKRFVDRFQQWGLRQDVFMPCYGMAEATLTITMSPGNGPVRVDTIDRTAAVTHGQVIDVDPGEASGMQVVACGVPVAGTEIRIVDGDGNPLGDNQIGDIQFRSPARTVGYFGLPQETAAAIAEPDWWKTGDVGYLRDGEIRITGRSKDLIIIRGANYFPSDIEQAAESVPGVRLGTVVAVGHRPEDGDSEELHLIVESYVPTDQHEPLRQAIRAAVSAQTGVPVAQVHLVPRRSIPKTTSGKLQRAKARQLFIENPAPAPA